MGREATIGVKETASTGTLILRAGGSKAFEMVGGEYTVAHRRLRGGFGDEPVFLESGPAFHNKLSSNPGTSTLSDGQQMIAISDGSSGVAGSDGDLVRWRNNGGTIEFSVIDAASGFSSV